MGSSQIRKHPQLARKLKLLYNLRLNPEIRSNADLARRLGVSRQAISKWCKGSETSLGDAIPLDQLDRLEEEFGIDCNWFSLEIEEFEPKVRSCLETNKLVSSRRPEKISNLFAPLVNNKLCGRDSELIHLDNAWASDHANVVQVVGFGGVGKSSLVHHWLSSLDIDNYRGAKYVYLWSFYWQGTSEDTKASGEYFVEHALEWFGDKTPSEGTPWAKATRLINLIRNAKTLIVLDGLETLQHPPGHREGEIENPSISLLIRELATEIDGLCVITSRLQVAELQSFTDFRASTLELKNLPLEASTNLLQVQGLRGEQIDFEHVAKEYAGHPLSLTLLAGYLNVVYDGEISNFSNIDSLVREKNQAYHAKNIVRAYLNWFKGPPEHDLLLILGIFDRGISLTDLKSLAAYGQTHELTRNLFPLSLDDWSYAFDRLKRAKIAFTEKRGSDIILEAHPLVRDFLADYLASEREDLWQSGNELIFKYFEFVALPNPTNMVDLEPLFRAVIHGCRAGLYKEAYKVYFERIKRGQVSIFAEGSHHADQNCIRSFFREPWTEPVKCLENDAKFYLLTSAAVNLIYLGEIRDAISPCMVSINWYLENEMWIPAANAAGPLASMLIASGNLLDAEKLSFKLDKCISNTNDEVIEANFHMFQGYIHYLQGRSDVAQSLFVRADKVICSDKSASKFKVPTVSSYYCKYLLENGYLNEALNRSLKTFEWRRKNTWQVEVDTTSLQASDLLVLGMTYLKMGELKKAKDKLFKQVELFRSVDEWLYLPTGLNFRALYFSEIEDFESAETDLIESLHISKRTGANFGEWEAYLNFMILNYEKGDLDKAREYLNKALSMPKMRAYKFRNAQIKEYAEKMGMNVELD